VVYNFEQHHKIWYCWDPRVLWTADQLRKRYGKVLVNTWKWGGSLQYCGWRPKKPPIGQSWSEWTQHAWFRALDMHFQEVSAEEIRQEIKAHWADWNAFQYIRCIEAGVSWLHIDTRNYDGLLVVKP
jgi:hypothetical protein